MLVRITKRVIIPGGPLYCVGDEVDLADGQYLIEQNAAEAITLPSPPSSGDGGVVTASIDAPPVHKQMQTPPIKKGQPR